MFLGSLSVCAYVCLCVHACGWRHSRLACHRLLVWVMNLEKVMDGVFCRLEQHTTPEIFRTPLHELCLSIKLLRLGPIGQFMMKAVEPPPVDAVIEAEALLRGLSVCLPACLCLFVCLLASLSVCLSLVKWSRLLLYIFVHVDGCFLFFCIRNERVILYFIDCVSLLLCFLPAYIWSQADYVFGLSVCLWVTSGHYFCFRQEFLIISLSQVASCSSDLLDL